MFIFTYKGENRFLSIDWYEKLILPASLSSIEDVPSFNEDT